MDTNEWGDAEEKLKGLDAKLHDVMFRYIDKCADERKEFPGEYAAIVATFINCFAHVLAAGAMAMDIDREKFVLHLDEIANKVKRSAQSNYDYLVSQEKDEGPGDL